MKYMGGKAKLANWIVAHLDKLWRTDMTYFEPFVGGANVLVEFKKQHPEAFCIGADLHEDLILMWEALTQTCNPWEPPTVMSEVTYKELRAASPSALRGFAGFGCSWGGKWFGGWARGCNSNGRARNYCDEAARLVVSKAASLRDVTFVRKDYREWTPAGGWLIYCDPPYADTTGYKGGFDHLEFWQTMERWSQHNMVVVSEYRAPANWVCIGARARNESLRTKGIGCKPVEERLYIYAGNVCPGGWEPGWSEAIENNRTNRLTAIE